MSKESNYGMNEKKCAGGAFGWQKAKDGNPCEVLLVENGKKMCER